MKKMLSLIICAALLFAFCAVPGYTAPYYKCEDVDILWDFEDGSLSGWEASDSKVTISVEDIGTNNKALRLDYAFADKTAMTWWDKAEIRNTNRLDLSGYEAITYDIILDPSLIDGDGRLMCSACYCTEGFAQFKSLTPTTISSAEISSDKLTRIKCTSPLFSDVGIIEQVLVWVVAAAIDYNGPIYVDNIGFAKELTEQAENSYIQPLFETPVEKNGHLQVIGTDLCNEKGEPVQLMGMSMPMIMKQPEFVTRNTFQALAYDWKCDVVRLAIDVGENYCYEGTEENKAFICKAADLAIETGMYFILDWHGLQSGDPLAEEYSGAGDFFDYFSKKYAGVPNIIYEVFNEPNGNITWAGNVKPYAENMIDIIRANDPDSVIVVGCCTWSQDVNECADDPINAENIMYTLHFYSGTHKQSLRDKAQYALDKGIALFATEWGMTTHTGSDGIFVEESEIWLDFLKNNNISWTNWCVYNGAADSAVISTMRTITEPDEYGFALREPTPTSPDHISDFGYAYWPENELSFCGNYVRNYIRNAHPEEAAELSISGIELENNSGTYSAKVSTVGGSSVKRYSYYLIGDGKIVFSAVYSDSSSAEFSIPDDGNYELRVYVDDSKGKRVTSTYTV